MSISIADAIKAASRARRSRFQVAPKIQRTVDGITFDSKKEATRYGELKVLEKAGLISDLMLQKKFPVQIGGKHFCNYSADFVYYDREQGRTIVEDVKSTGTAKDAAYRLRVKAAELAHGIVVDEVIR